MNASTAVPIASQAIASTPDQAQTGTRLESLDFIRGIAVMGIVIANMAGFGGYPMSHPWPVIDGALTFGEEVVWLLQYIFVDGKFRGIFSVLFGAGMAIFMERALAKGGNAVWLQVRRLFWLALFGLAHMMLIYWGDILWHYALSGFLALLLIRFLPGKWLLGIGVALFLLNTIPPYLALSGFKQFEQAALAAPDGDLHGKYMGLLDKERGLAAESYAVMSEGSYLDTVEHRIFETNGPELFSHPERTLPEYGLLMLIGAGLYKLGFFALGAGARRRLLGWGMLGIGVSAAVAIYFGIKAIEGGHAHALSYFTFYGPSYAYRLWMILGLIAVMVAIAPMLAGGWIRERISAAGRMAFTNYIGTSVVMGVIFQGWGFGLYGRFDKVEMLGFVLLAWALMLLCSKPWLERFRFGPLEWAWRCLTYWQVFAIKK